MNLTIATFSLEISRGSVFAHLGDCEVFITWAISQPLKFFSWRHEGGNKEFWGMGFHGVVSVGLPAPRVALIEG